MAATVNDVIGENVDGAQSRSTELLNGGGHPTIRRGAGQYRAKGRGCVGVSKREGAVWACQKGEGLCGRVRKGRGCVHVNTASLRVHYHVCTLPCMYITMYVHYHVCTCTIT